MMHLVFLSLNNEAFSNFQISFQTTYTGQGDGFEGSQPYLSRLCLQRAATSKFHCEQHTSTFRLDP